MSTKSHEQRNMQRRTNFITVENLVREFDAKNVDELLELIEPQRYDLLIESVSTR
jgi:hypothetical protein